MTVRCFDFFAESNGKSDILAALGAGHSFITFAPDGLTCELTSGVAMMGDSVVHEKENVVNLQVAGLRTGDVVRVVTNSKSDVLLTATSDGKVDLTYKVEGTGFVLAEVLRSFLPRVPMLPALITNPIYFD